MIAKTIREKDALRMNEINPRKKKKYIDLFADDAVFFGTDISERWPKLNSASMQLTECPQVRGGPIL